MQRLAKRAVQAQRQAVRRAQHLNKRQDVDIKLRSRENLRIAAAEVRESLKAARTARREDWELGPLAPKRDLGFNEYGSVGAAARRDWTQQGAYAAHPRLVEQRCAWAGGARQLNLAPGDRVVIQDGPDVGKIDRIREIQIQAGSVTLESHHQALGQSQLGNPAQTLPMPLSIGSIRLVYPLTNPETGVTKDTIIHQLKAVPPNMQSPNMTLDRWTYGNKWDRVVPGINVVIPWPEVQAPELETTAMDTAREQIEDRTFYYSLLSPPMPESVVDELRNKYSRFRTRHEPEYLAKKEAAEASRKGRMEAARAMQMPLAEFHQRQQEIRAERGEPELTEEMMEKIGQWMARKRERASPPPAPSIEPTTPQ